MTEREFEQRLHSFFRAEVAAAGRVPAELREGVWAIPDEVPTSQPASTSRRMLLLLAATMLLALVVGTAIAVGAGLIPWLDDDDATELSLPLPWERQAQTDMPAGRYYLDVASSGGFPSASTIRMTFSLPSGWERVPVEGMLWGQTKWVVMGVFDRLYLDPCRPNRGTRQLPADARARDVATALQSLPGWEVTTITPAALGGYRGVKADLMAPADSSDCVNGEQRLMQIHGLYNYVPAMRDGEPMQVWILDVRGLLVVIAGGHDPMEASGADREELQGVIASIEIDPSIPRAPTASSTP